MSPAGVGAAAYRAARDWARARNALSLVVLAPFLLIAGAGLSAMIVGAVFGICFVLYYGFAHAPLWTLAGLAAWCAFAYLMHRFGDTF